MAYINFDQVIKKEISYIDVLILQCCKQMSSEKLSEHLIALCEEDPEKLLALEDKGLLKFVKDGKSIFEKARLSPAGTELLNSFEFASVSDEDLIVWDWLVKKYKSLEKEIGNATKGKKWLAAFRAASGIEKNNLVILCKSFIADESKMTYSHKLEYLFFKPSHAFDVRFSLESSKLWSYYQENKAMFDEKFKAHAGKS